MPSIACLDSALEVVPIFYYLHVSHPSTQTKFQQRSGQPSVSHSPFTLLVLLPSPSTHIDMHTFSQIIPFFQAYFELFKFASAGLVLRRQQVHGSPWLIQRRWLRSLCCVSRLRPRTDGSKESEPSTDDNKFSGEDLLRAAADLDLDALPSFPYLFKFPEPRPPIDMPASAPCKQDFGTPSNLYYDRRPHKFQALVVIVKTPASHQSPYGHLFKTLHLLWSSSLFRLNSLSSKSSWLFRTNLLLSLDPRSLSPSRCIPIVKLAPSLQPATVSRLPSVAVPASVINKASAPGSEKWNTTKATVLTQARLWNEQGQVARRYSLPPLPIPVPAPVDGSRRRYSVPPVLAPLKPRLNVSDRLSALFKEAKDTIDALNEKSAEDTVGRKQDVPMFSAVVLEEGRGQEVFIIGDDDHEIIANHVRSKTPSPPP
ncbi:hypothetical protein MSAN_01287900 [Mycena sanguinolenta]|uniref:Uncharacterized protein n=1 Tax=Mycena sanguinolenta TaxID=230812 RepID=A0A8H6YIZ5_9AGAR|nr:hypothetical protein MSAN_01287900 [Mycena sanguinolenta]